MIKFEDFLKDWHKIIEVHTEEDAKMLKDSFGLHGFKWSFMHDPSEVPSMIQQHGACYCALVGATADTAGIFDEVLEDDIVYDISQVIINRSIDADAFENILFM